jgi:hypothetical protein
MQPALKTTNPAEIEDRQRRYWWSKTPQQRLAAADALIARGRRLYAANPANPPLLPAHGARALKSTAPVRRGGR